MKIKCIKNNLSKEEVQLHKLQYGDYSHIEIGSIYHVYGLNNFKGYTNIDYYDKKNKYLSFAPLILFEIIDNKVNPNWIIRFNDIGNYEIGFKPILENKFYWDDLIAGDKEIVNHFEKLRCIVEGTDDLDELLNFKLK